MNSNSQCSKDDVVVDIEADWASGQSPEETHPCPKCGSHDTHVGYGFAAGGLGGYEMCMECGEVLNSWPEDME